MSHQVLFIQGGGQDTHDKWDNKLAANLAAELGPDYEIRYPRMPDEGDPKYALWKAALENEFAKLKGRATLVGHSIGGTILISFLAEAASPAIRTSRLSTSWRYSSRCPRVEERASFFSRRAVASWR